MMPTNMGSRNSDQPRRLAGFERKRSGSEVRGDGMDRFTRKGPLTIPCYLRDIASGFNAPNFGGETLRRDAAS